VGRAIGRDNPRRAMAMAAFGVISAIAVLDFVIAARATLNKREDREAAA
jgi:hypothetical protein